MINHHTILKNLLSFNTTSYRSNLKAIKYIEDIFKTNKKFKIIKVYNNHKDKCSILIKPNLDFISTKPNIYVDNDTYLAVNYDWSNIEEKIDYALSNFKELQLKFVENMRKKFIELNKEENLALHLYEIFKNLKEVGIDE